MNARGAAVLAAIMLVTTSRMAAGQSLTLSNTSEGPITITTAVPGSDPTSVVRSTTTYWVVNPVGNGIARISVDLATALPAGTSLFINLGAPTGATSLGQIALTTLAQDAVVNIPEGTDMSGLTITYTFTATAAAGFVPSQSVNVNFNIQ